MRALAVFASLFVAGCIVVPTTNAAHKPHPHGGPPGQMKKHHDHAATCGHERVQHNGVWIYHVDGAWWKHTGGKWVTVVYHDPKGKTKAKAKAKPNAKGKKK